MQTGLTLVYSIWGSTDLDRIQSMWFIVYCQYSGSGMRGFLFSHLRICTKALIHTWYLSLFNNLTKAHIIAKMLIIKKNCWKVRDFVIPSWQLNRQLRNFSNTPESCLFTDHFWGSGAFTIQSASSKLHGINSISIKVSKTLYQKHPHILQSFWIISTEMTL